MQDPSAQSTSESKRDPAVTSRMMGKVKQKNSKAEIAIRKRLHAMGLRYRLHQPLIGRPDIVFPKETIAVFVDGDMWHGNAWRLRGLNSLAELFPSRTEWWVAKITRNMERDTFVTMRLEAEGWTVVRVWESEILKDADAVAEAIAALVWISRCENA
ncbi:MAG: very short patch repair endonuclease [Thermomicrobiales bacterium]